MKKIEDLLIFEPHNMLVSGVTNCGKTHFILKLLETEYKNKFENIVLFCPTYFYNTTYNKNWIYGDKNVIIINPKAVEKDLNTILKFAIETFKGSNTLFIIDDCANLHDAKKKASELCYLAFSGRHYKITTWVLNQKYNSIVKDFRQNIQLLILFFNKDKDAMQLALDENNIIPLEKRPEIIKQLKDKKCLKLIIKLDYPYDYSILP
jgi:hypothetical protein